MIRLEHIIEDLGENKVIVYEFSNDIIIPTEETVMSRLEAITSFNIVGEMINGDIKLFSEEDPIEDSDEAILEYMGLEIDDD